MGTRTLALFTLTCIRTRAHTHTRKHTCATARTRTRAHTHTRAQTNARTRTRAHMHTRPHALPQDTRTLAHAYAQTNTHKHERTRTNRHTHTHAHTRTRLCKGAAEGNSLLKTKVILSWLINEKMVEQKGRGGGGGAEKNRALSLPSDPP